MALEFTDSNFQEKALSGGVSVVDFWAEWCRPCRLIGPLWAKWAGNDPERQWNALADQDVFVMPGRVMNAPDYFRICLTASDAMVAKALPAFARAG